MSTYTPISTVTLASDASEIVFTGLPQTYTDLVIMGSVASADTSLNRGLRIQLNSDTGNNYSRTGMYGETSAVSFRESSTSFIGTVEIPPTTSGWGSIVLNLQNYSNTTTNKTVISKGGAPANQITASVGLWRNTAAITSVRFFTSGSNIRSGSTLTVYGIGAGSPKAFGGDEVRTDGTYWYHIYRSSGIFAPMSNLSCDYLVVAGGGAGGAAATNDYGGGGGAGGLRSTVTATGGGGSLESALNLTGGTNYTVTIGAGGVGGSASWTSGSNSVFATITSTGGGAGGGINTIPAWTQPLVGGSGGGGEEANLNGANGTTNQGYKGGNSVAGHNAGGGGGGAGGLGANSTTNVGGVGGSSVSVSITGSSVAYAGGGGGSGPTGGAGGGGGGGAGSSGTATAGTANTGGGGGSGNRAGANGGSGIVVVRYAV